MKKFLFTIIAVLYLGMSSGIAMEVHYCMGKLAGIEFFGGGTDKCGKCGMQEKKGGCCNDEHHFIKISDSHKCSVNTIDFSLQEFVQNISFEDYYIGTPVKIITKQVYYPSPPDYALPDRCILLCVFRI